MINQRNLLSSVALALLLSTRASAQDAATSIAWEGPTADQSREFSFVSSIPNNPYNTQSFCLPSGQQLIKVTNSDAKANTPAHISIVGDVDRNCINVNATWTAPNPVCRDVPEVKWGAIFPTVEQNKRCTDVPTTISLTVNYVVGIYSVFTHWNAPPGLAEKAQQDVKLLNAFFSQQGIKVSEPDHQSYVGQRANHPQRLVVYYWEQDRRESERIAALANDWVQSSQIGGPNFNVLDNTTASEKGPHAAVAVEFWLPE
jgi:hypothetical protein